MTTDLLREARSALSACCADSEMSLDEWRENQDLIARIDAALAQPAASEPQPVGRMEESGIIEGLIIPVVEGEFPEGTLLYAAPPAAPRTLTDAEIDAIADDMPGGMDGFLKSWGWRQFARAIARALSAIPEQP